MKKMPASLDEAPIALITTGGTMDAFPYRETPENIIPLKQSLVPMALQKMGYKAEQDFHSNPAITDPATGQPYRSFRADSKYFLTHEQYIEEHEKGELPDLEQNRVAMDQFVDYLLALKEDRILITHGSDALVRNAQTLFNDPRIKASGKTIIMTLAMEPLANFYRKKNETEAFYTLSPAGDYHTQFPDFSDPKAYQFDDPSGYPKISDGYANLQGAMDMLKSQKLAPGVHIVANHGTFLSSNDMLQHVEKEFNVQPQLRFFYHHDTAKFRAAAAKQKLATSSLTVTP